MKIKAHLFTKFKNEEEGFTLLEAVASLLIVSFILLGLTATMLSSYKALRDSRMYQQATNLGNKEIETARAVTFDSLALVDTDPTLATDTRIVSSCTGHPAGKKYFDPDPSSATIKCEPLVASASGGAVDEHITSKTVGATTFTVRRYVTWVDATTQGGTSTDYKRYTVIVEWTRGDQTGEYSTSTMISRSQRGLPIPKFQVTPTAQTKAVAPGNQVVFPHTVRNLGINDTYDVQLEVPVSRSWSVAYYKDTDADGVYDAGTDTALFDSNTSGKPDTGLVTTNQTFYFLVVFNVAAGEAVGTEVMDLTVTSGIDNAVLKSVKDTLRVGDPSQLLYLHHDPSPPTANTTAKVATAMDLDAPTATTLYNYSTDYANTEGRWVLKGKKNNDRENKPKEFVSWVTQMAETSTFQGTAVVTIWVAADGFACNKQVDIDAYLLNLSTATATSGTIIGSAAAVLPKGGSSGTCSFRKMTINIPINATIQMNRWLELKLVINDDVADPDDGIFAFDTTTYPSTVLIPEVFN